MAIAPISEDFFQQERSKNEPILPQTEFKTRFSTEIAPIYENPRSATVSFILFIINIKITFRSILNP